MNSKTIRIRPETPHSIAIAFAAALFVLGWLVLGCSGAEAHEDESETPPSAAGERAGATQKPSDVELRSRLTPLQYRVTQQDGTEPAFQNEYWDNKKPGVYVDVVTGEPLFSSLDKFESGTGWPSFTQPIEADSLVRHTDHKLLLPRVEVRSKLGDSHLGHVFQDGPKPTGLRYCINSAALRFVPDDHLEAEGLGRYLDLFAPQRPAKQVDSGRTETAILAGGCFWGMEQLLRELPGVIDTEVGYASGALVNASSSAGQRKTTDKAEAVQVIFNPEQLTYARLLAEFFRMHDPTTKNRQGNDIGSQYRSAIFTDDPEQARIATEVMARIEASGKWKRPLTTEVVPATTFRPAEDFHQDYLVKNPRGYTCHFLREFDFEAETAR